LEDDVEKGEMELYTERIKQVMEWFPGVTLGLGRQVGKTEAIIRTIHDRHRGHAAVIIPTVSLSEILERRYKESYPDDEQPIFTDDPLRLRGRERRPVYVDEPWAIPESKMRAIYSLGWPVLARIGTSSW
jgi:hypothetical protein